MSIIKILLLVGRECTFYKNIFKGKMNYKIVPFNASICSAFSRPSMIKFVNKLEIDPSTTIHLLYLLYNQILRLHYQCVFTFFTVERRQFYKHYNMDIV